MCRLILLLISNIIQEFLYFADLFLLYCLFDCLFMYLNNLVLFFNILSVRFECIHCKKSQQSYIFHDDQINYINKCAVNIDTTATLKCTNNNSNPKFNDQTMINAYYYNSDKLHNRHINKWFQTKHKLLCESYQQCNNILNCIKILHKKCMKNIQLKIEALNTKIKRDNINEYLLYATIRQLQIYEQFVTCFLYMHTRNKQIQNDSTIKHCILCEKDYYNEMLFCKQYFANQNWYYFSQCMNNYDICCGFCLKNVEQYYNLIIQQNNGCNKSYNIAHAVILDENLDEYTKYLCWWDLQEYMWRYGIIRDVMDETTLTLKIEALDSDQICPCEFINITLKYKENNTFFVCWYDECHCDKSDTDDECHCDKSYTDDEFTIDSNNEHLQDWYNFKNCWQSNWQIPIRLSATNEHIPVNFEQIHNSKQLWNTLCVLKKL